VLAVQEMRAGILVKCEVSENFTASTKPGLFPISRVVLGWRWFAFCSKEFPCDGIFLGLPLTV
jgi:hypothetical protein